MAKTKTNKANKPPKPTETPEQLYELALSHAEQSSPAAALECAERLLALVQTTSPTPSPAALLPAFNLLGDINVELGEIETARKYFLQAVELDPAGEIPETQGGGSEKFLWLAQLCEEGGAESVGWFERGVGVLKREIGVLEAGQGPEGLDEESREVLLEEKRAKLCGALCGVVEVYMTDLSWEEDAEQRCEALITEALMVAPENPEALQTLASVRLSQLKVEDARSALARSIAIWKDLDPEDPTVPDFPTRISLARLLMEAEMEEEAMDVLERLALEDDQSVEACYLGGWCLHLIAEKNKQTLNGAAKDQSSEESEDLMRTMKASRSWLLNTLKLYELLDYEDERLKEHSMELVSELNQVLGPPPEDGKEDEDDEWEGLEDDDASMDGQDEEMTGI